MKKVKPIVIALASALVLPMAGFGVTAAHADDAILIDTSEVFNEEITVIEDAPITEESPTTPSEIIEVEPKVTVPQPQVVEPEGVNSETSETLNEEILPFEETEEETFVPQPVDSTLLSFDGSNGSLEFTFSDMQNDYPTGVIPTYIIELYSSAQTAPVSTATMNWGNEPYTQYFRNLDLGPDYFVVITKIVANQTPIITTSNTVKTTSTEPFELSSIKAYIDDERNLIVDWSDHVLNGSTLDRYQINVVGGGHSYGRVFNVLDEPSTQVTTIVVDGNTNYSVSFTLYDSDGFSQTASTMVEVPYFTPTEVQNLRFNSIDGVIDWDAPIDNGGDHGLYYQIDISQNGGDHHIYLASDLGGLWIYDYSPTPGSEIRISVKAIGKGGSSEATNLLHVEPLMAPDAPRNVLITANGSQIRATWSAPETDGGAEINTYGFYLFDSAGDDVTRGQFSGAITDDQLEIFLDVLPGETYYLTVTAITAAGESEAATSNSIQVRPDDTPAFMTDEETFEYLQGQSEFRVVYNPDNGELTIIGVNVEDDWIYAVMEDGTAFGWDDRADYGDRGDDGDDDVFSYQFTDPFPAGMHNVLIYGTNGVIGFGSFFVAPTAADNDNGGDNGGNVGEENNGNEGGVATPPVNSSPAITTPNTNALDGTVSSGVSHKAHNLNSGHTVHNELEKTGSEGMLASILAATALVGGGMILMGSRLRARIAKK